MKVKEFKIKLAEAERAVAEARKNLETVVEEIKTFVMTTDDYDVVIGREACDRLLHPDTRRKIKEAKRIFVFEDAECKETKTYRDICEEREKRSVLLFSPDAEFSPVVLFFGFCDDCFRDEYKRGIEVARALKTQREDLLVRFSGFHPEGVVDGRGTEVNLI